MTDAFSEIETSVRRFSIAHGNMLDVVSPVNAKTLHNPFHDFPTLKYTSPELCDVTEDSAVEDASVWDHHDIDNREETLTNFDVADTGSFEMSEDVQPLKKRRKQLNDALTGDHSEMSLGNTEELEVETLRHPPPGDKSMLWYGTGMLRTTKLVPTLRVYPDSDLVRMTNAKCEWINVPKLKGVIHPSINKASQELRRVNLGLNVTSKRKTCNIWDHFTIDRKQTIKVKQIRDSVGFSGYVS
jgi:hypothetical protein